MAKLNGDTTAWTAITRAPYRRDGPDHASDLTVAEWALIDPHLRACGAIGQRRQTSIRRVIETILVHGVRWRWWRAVERLLEWDTTTLCDLIASESSQPRRRDLSCIFD